MIYLVSLILLLQSIFYWLLRPPTMILDSILECLIERDMSVSEVVSKGYEYRMVKKIEKLVYQSEYKRFQSPPGVHLTKNSFRLSRRYPLIQHWRDS